MYAYGQIERLQFVAGSGCDLWAIDPCYGRDTVDLYHCGYFHSRWRRDQQSVAVEFARLKAAGQPVPQKILRELEL